MSIQELIVSARNSLQETLPVLQGMALTTVSKTGALVQRVYETQEVQTIATNPNVKIFSDNAVGSLAACLPTHVTPYVNIAAGAAGSEEMLTEISNGMIYGGLGACNGELQKSLPGQIAQELGALLTASTHNLDSVGKVCKYLREHPEVSATPIGRRATAYVINQLLEILRNYNNGLITSASQASGALTLAHGALVTAESLQNAAHPKARENAQTAFKATIYLLTALRLGVDIKNISGARDFLSKATKLAALGALCYRFGIGRAAQIAVLSGNNRLLILAAAATAAAVTGGITGLCCPQTDGESLQTEHSEPTVEEVD